MLCASRVQMGPRVGGLVVVALVATLLSGVGVVTAGADTFSPANTTPTVSSPSLSATIQPDTGASETEYSYAVTVGDAETLNDLATVAVCLYNTAGGDATCATPDPATDVKLVWTASTGLFTVDDGSGNNYWANGASPAPSAPTLTGTNGLFTFTFTVSEAMREGGWTASVTATDTTGATATDASATTSVNHYSVITTRVSQDFGSFAAGLGAGGTSLASPTVTSNGPTTFGLTAGNFTDGANTFTLKTDGLTSVAPAAGQVTLDCMMGSTFTEGSATRVGSTSTLLSSARTSTGTAEAGTTEHNICRLAHGGQRPINTYSFTVINTVANG
jgi:hypothetical protein